MIKINCGGIIIYYLKKTISMMTKEEFKKLPKEERGKILSRYNEHINNLENSIWDHDPGEYELEWFLFFNCRDCGNSNTRKIDYEDIDDACFIADSFRDE